jgi:pimeloyl-ACP methyl ester carboxylesterase
MTPPETRYARSGDLRIAYQVVGDGPFDLIFVPGFVSNIELWWERPEWANFFNRLAGFSRLILFDKRGTGLSDRVAGVANLEERMDDVRAVMDAAGCERAALFGVSEGGPMSLLFAATYPQRVRGLVLFGSFARHPFLTVESYRNERIEMVDRSWGTGEYTLGRFVPTLSSDEAVRRDVARWERLSASPSATIAILQMNSEIDARHILPMIRVPTLIMHRVGDQALPVENGRYLAENIPGAKYVELPGDNHIPLFEPEIVDRIVGEAEEFLTGSRSEAEIDRILATVMFTDIVDSTKRAAELGDRSWHALLDRHHGAVRRQLSRFRGQQIKNLGDGVLATFDGPARGVRCACAIADEVRALGIEVRAGLHAGECEMLGDDLGGIAVHIGARVAALAGANEVLVSSTVKDLVAGSGLRFGDRGRQSLKGVPGEWHIFAVER